MHKAIIFDVDGTLVHTSPEYPKKIVNEILIGCGKPPAADDDIEAFWFGEDREGCVQRWGVPVAEWWRLWIEKDTLQAFNAFVSTYPDVGFLDVLAKRYRLGILTGAHPGRAMYEIGLIGEEKFASIVITYERGVQSKPHPEGMHVCLSELAVQPSEAVFVGNGPEDIGCAKAAGVLDVWLDRGEYDHGVAASITIKDLHELERYLE